VKTLGLSCAHLTSDNDESHGFELQSLYDEGQKAYDEVLFINPQEILYIFERGKHKPEIRFHERDIADLSTLIVRGTAGSERALSLLTRTLDHCGCLIFDPIARFSGKTSSKITSTFDRFRNGIGTDSYLTFYYEGAKALIRYLDSAGKFPILTKPVFGKKGKGLIVFYSASEADAYIQNFYTTKNDIPLLIQPFLQFVEEYRVMVIDGFCPGVVKKIKQEHAIAANAAQGGEFVAVNKPEIINFVLRNASSEGLLGVDVGKDEQGRLHQIEANRAPLWEHFQIATGINIAKIVIEKTLERLNRKRSYHR